MALSKIFINNFRNLEKIELRPLVQGFNLLYGHNGSGKTSFLEAIYYLGHRRSFKSLNADHLIRHNSDQFNIFSYILDQSSELIPLGIERSQDGQARVRAAGQDLSTLSELASFLPMRFINVHSHYLIEGSPNFRRKYLDWGIFYQNKEFPALWFRYRRLLKQRNAALRRRATFSELACWTEELVEAALLFHDFRLAYLEQLLPFLKSLFSKELSPFFDLSELSIDYRPGWDTSESYADLLSANRAKDYERGSTQLGPHRADLSFKIKQLSAKEVLSTGQQKLLVCGMILAQGALLSKLGNKRPIYLIDDLAAELDQQGRLWLITALAEQQAQIFVTAVEQEAMSGVLAQSPSPVKMFHVKHGTINEVPCST